MTRKSSDNGHSDVKNVWISLRFLTANLYDDLMESVHHHKFKAADVHGSAILKPFEFPVAQELHEGKVFFTPRHWLFLSTDP